jgi:hypothetical protein
MASRFPAGAALQAAALLAKKIVDGLVLVGGDGARGGVGLLDDGVADGGDEGGVGVGVQVEIGAQRKVTFGIGEINSGIYRAELFENPLHGFAEEPFDFEFLADGGGEVCGDLRGVELHRHVLIGPHEIVAEEIHLLTNLVSGLVELFADAPQAETAVSGHGGGLAAAGEALEEFFEFRRGRRKEQHVEGPGAEGVERDFVAAETGEGHDVGVGINAANGLQEGQARVVVNL